MEGAKEEETLADGWRGLQIPARASQSSLPDDSILRPDPLDDPFILHSTIPSQIIAR